MAKLGSFASYTSFRNVICRPYGARKCSGGMGDMFRGFAPTAIMCRPYRARKKQPNSLSKFSQIYFQNSAKFTFKKRPNSLSKNSQIHFQKTAKFTFKKRPNYTIQVSHVCEIFDSNFIGEAGKLPCRGSGFLSRPMQRHPTTSHRRSWEASL